MQLERGGKHGSHQTDAREAKNDFEEPPGVITPDGAESSKVVHLTSTERAELREKALAYLVKTAQGGTPEERANAIEALSPTPARLAGIAELALKDQSPAVRSVTAMSIGRAKLAGLAPRVRPLLQDDSPFSAAASAIYALKRCGQNVDLSPLSVMLFDPNPRVRAQGAFILGELGEKSAVAMVRDAQHANMSRANPAEVKLSDLQLSEARVKLGDDTALPEIRTALFPARPEELEASVLAIQIVGEVRDVGSTNWLIQLVAPKDATGGEIPGEIRIAAAASLAKLGQPQGSYVVREYFRGGSEALRAQSAHLLGETGHTENLQIVSQMMDDPDGRVRSRRCGGRRQDHR